MASSSPLHFILFPLMAPGHMIPMIDIAKLISRQNVTVSLITTPKNAARFRPTIDRSGYDIRLLEVRFPSVEAGLPEGCENLDALPSLDLAANFFVAINLLQKDVGKLFDEMSPPPSCVISDMGLPWTTQIAERFGIPRIVFHGTCCFSLLCSYNTRASGVLDSLESDMDEFEVPNLPHKIKLRKSQVVGGASNKKSTVLKDVTDQIRAAEKVSYGVVVNSFVELEAEYVEEYGKVKGEKVWCIGPVSLCNKDVMDLSDRGNTASITEQDCVAWLDGHEPGTVIYASLGSLARLTVPQMMELAFGLEASNKPFIWALGAGDKLGSLEKCIMEDGFEDRTKGRGLVIRGWAPQLLILSHSAVGGFLTHCGWNSTLEGISAGMPMVTWPLFAEQFCNEKLVVEVLGIGVSMGVQVPVKWGEEEKMGLMVKREEVSKALDKLMDDGEEGKERRRKAKMLGEASNRAIEDGGSSNANLKLLVQEIKEKIDKK